LLNSIAHQSLWQITDNSAVDSQPKENQLWCSKYPIYCCVLQYLFHVMCIRPDGRQN